MVPVRKQTLNLRVKLEQEIAVRKLFRRKYRTDLASGGQADNAYDP